MLGLEIGGDDYVTKPFSPRDLVTRINVILKRARAAPPQAQDRTLAQGDPIFGQPGERGVDVSIHAPARGATDRAAPTTGGDACFDPRPCERGDPLLRNARRRLAKGDDARGCAHSFAGSWGEGAVRWRLFSTMSRARPLREPVDGLRIAWGSRWRSRAGSQRWGDRSKRSSVRQGRLRALPLRARRGGASLRPGDNSAGCRPAD